MTTTDELKRENEALRERGSRLNAAILRINEGLDLETVLTQVLDSARDLTGARNGAITIVDAEGRPQEFVFSGCTPEEQRQLAGWVQGPQLFEHLRDAAPLRLADFPAWLRSLGFSAEMITSKTMQATPMRHRGEDLGAFFVGEKEGGAAFTDADEEILVLFASQAAAAIVNARTHREERRARADLEALIETSPIGVVVFDAGTGRPVSFNREAKRIVEGLRIGDRPLEDLLEVLTFRFSDGREIALAEFPLARVVSGAEAVRAEQIELSVPDGRRITMLVNATPIQSADGAVESLVVTMQDLAPLRELERSRTEFLSVVSHELRAPLTSIKGSTATVLDRARGLDPAEARQFFRIIDQQADRMDALITDLLDAGRIETGTLKVTPGPTDVAALVDQARNTFLSGGGRHVLEIDLPPELPRVMADERRILQVLNNLLSNAARYSPETSPHPHRRGARRGPRRDLGHRPGPGRAARAPAPPVPQVHRRGRRHPRLQERRARTGPFHLPGSGRGARGPDPGGERRARSGDAVHLHASGRRGGRRGRRLRPSRHLPQRVRASAHSGGG